jgi:outer membrane protein assembly factor BamE (lipoprotein component of BamABCDE complex)
MFEETIMLLKFFGKTFLLSAFFISCLSGCMSFGRQFPSQTNWIEKESTTTKDVLDLLGKPYSVGTFDGTPLWTYLFSKYSMGAPLQQKELKIYWTEMKTVKYFQFTSSFSEDLEKYSGTKKE